MNWGYLIAGSLVFLGVSLFFYFSTRKNYYQKKVEPIQEYSDIRDKVTLRNKKEEPVEEESYHGGFLGNIIGGLVVILVGISLVHTIASQVNTSMALVNSTSILTSTTIQLISGFFVFMILVIAITTMVEAFRNAELV